LVRGGGHTRLRLKGWGSPNSNEGTYTVVLYIFKYFVCYWLFDVVDFPSVAGVPSVAKPGDVSAFVQSIIGS
jgi:hypothetical protein